MKVIYAALLASAATPAEAFLSFLSLKPAARGRLVEASSTAEAVSSCARPARPTRRKWATTSRAPQKATAMLEGEGEGEGGATEGERQKGYTDVTVREAVEWTMGKDTEFTYIDVRSAEEHEKLATVRGALCIPAFEIVMPEVEEAKEGGEGQDGKDADDTVFAPDYNYEDLDYTVKPDFVETMKAQFDLDAKLLIGCKTARSAKACQLLVDAGFTEVYNVESQIFMRTRAPQVWS